MAMLASVRTLDEALLALRLGADLIDLKEPSRGALGALDHAAIRVMVQAIDRRRPVSATIGDVPEMDPEVIVDAVGRMAATGVDFIKVGFFAHERARDCARALAPLASQARLVAVLFADEPWTHISSEEEKGFTAPSPLTWRGRGVRSPCPSAPRRGAKEDLSAMLDTFAESGFAGAMLDTAQKNGKTLRDWRSDAELGAFVQQARGLGLLTGLAGSLRKDDVAPLLPIGPDYLGFRGALCRSGERVQVLDDSAFSRIRAEIPRGGRWPGAAVAVAA
jgi:dihydroneopterin aldolase